MSNYFPVATGAAIAYAPWRKKIRPGYLYLVDEENVPEEGDDFSWGDVFDVAAYYIGLLEPKPRYPVDLPPFLVRALQQGPETVPDAEVRAFQRRQRITGLRRAGRPPSLPPGLRGHVALAGEKPTLPSG